MSNMDANGDTHPVGIVDGDQRRIRRSLTLFWLSLTCGLWMASENHTRTRPPFPSAPGKSPHKNLGIFYDKPSRMQWF